MQSIMGFANKKHLRMYFALLLLLVVHYVCCLRSKNKIAARDCVLKHTE